FQTNIDEASPPDPTISGGFKHVFAAVSKGFPSHPADARHLRKSNTFSQQSQKASPATPLMPDIYEKHGKIDLLRAHQLVAVPSLMESQKVANHRFSFKAGPPAGGRVVFCKAAETV
ncbi:MAG: hypothetical protein AB1547_10635, partial [Thermodesulfobacteriota bacterium]